MPHRNDLLLLLARLLVAALFLPAGIQTLSNIASSTAYFEGLGLPVPMLAAWGVGLVEIIGGAMLLLGFRTSPAAVGLAIFCIAAGFIGHYGQGGGDATLRFLHTQMFWKDIAIAGGLLALAAAGGGAYSADARLRG